MMSDVIRIAQIMGKMENGGVEAVVMNYWRNIDKSRFRFDFIVDNDSSIPQKEEIEALGGRVITVPPYQKANAYISALTRILKENNYKIVHSHMNTLSVFSLLAARRAGVPVRIAHNHSTAGKGEHKKNVLKYMLRPFARVNATHCAACSEYAGDWLFGKGSVARGEVTVFNNAIDLNRFRFNPETRDRVRKALGLENAFVVGHVGRFCFQKNHEFLVDIFEKIHNQRAEARLLLIGEGSLVDSVREKIAAKKLSESTIFLGNRCDVNELYSAMDVFVLPSRYEGLPVVGVEAQAAGLPCVLSDAVTRETIMQSTTKMVALHEGAEKWCSEILATEGVRNVNAPDSMEKFDITKIVARLEKYYEKLL